MSFYDPRATDDIAHYKPASPEIVPPMLLCLRKFRPSDVKCLMTCCEASALIMLDCLLVNFCCRSSLDAGEACRGVVGYEHLRFAHTSQCLPPSVTQQHEAADFHSSRPFGEKKQVPSMQSRYCMGDVKP